MAVIASVDRRADASSRRPPKSFACQPAQTHVYNAHSVVISRQPGPIDLNLLHPTAAESYISPKEKIVSCYILRVDGRTATHGRWAKRGEEKRRAVETNRIVKIKKK